MAVDKNDAEAGSANGQSGLPKRRDRFEALKSRRQTLQTPSAAPAAMTPAGPSRPVGGLDALLAGPGRKAFSAAGGGRIAPGPQTAARPGVGPMQKKIMGMAYQMLTQTPADDRGQVTGTPFTVTGVERLMTLLSERAATEDAPGAKAAGAALAFLGASEDDADAVAGASGDKLVLLARRVETFQSGRGRQG